MKKVLTILLLSLIMTVGMFTEETDNEYWYNEADVDGRLLTYYFCKTDAQFDNIFKHIVNEQLGITYSFREPNWNSIKSGLVSIEYIKKNFPKFYNCMADNNTINWDNYKYSTNDGLLTKYCNNTEYGNEGFTDELTVPEEEKSNQE